MATILRDDRLGLFLATIVGGWRAWAGALSRAFLLSVHHLVVTSVENEEDGRLLLVLASRAGLSAASGSGGGWPSRSTQEFPPQATSSH